MAHDAGIGGGPTTQGSGQTAVKAPHRGILLNSALGIHIVFQYNPKATTDEIGNSWKETEIQGGASPLLTFQCGKPHTKHFELLLDAHASPHPDGHIGHDLNDLDMLCIPYDQMGLPLVIPPARGIRREALTKSDQVVGLPPLVKIAYGNRIQTGMIRSIKIEEVLHATTAESEERSLPTRANVSLDFYIVDDTRLLVYYEETAPSGEVPIGAERKKMSEDYGGRI